MTAENTGAGELDMAAAAGASRHEHADASLRLLARSHWPELAGLATVLAAAIIFDFSRLSQAGYGNAYYAAAVRSMVQNWHNFFFASFDPGGFVTIDKPPVGFWLQAASAKLFGFHGLSLMLPQALAGVLSVTVLFYLVRRGFGGIAGIVAALALALTPISVATNRNNTIDSLLALTSLAAAAAALVAVERGRLRWLVLAMALIGLGFNIKMAEALLILPAVSLTYLASAALSWRKRIAHLFVGALVLLIVSLSWIAVVDLTPAGQRPYVGSSQHNSELELALGYNGLNRLFPRRFFRGAPPSRPAQPAGTAPVDPQTGVGAPRAGAPPAGGFFGGGETGAPGALRLFNQQLGGQISWLIPLALLGFVAAVLQTRWRHGIGQQGRGLMLWGVWFLTGAVFFSVDRSFHRYYMVMFAPPVAALAGIGVAALWRDYLRSGWRDWLLPVALLITAAVQIAMLRPFPDWSHRLTPVLVVLCLVAVTILIAARLRPRVSISTRAAAAAATLGVLALCIAPAVWDGVTVQANTTFGMPAAGPAAGAFPFFGSDFGPDGPGRNRAAAAAIPFSGDAPIRVDPTLLSYLESHRGGARFLLATPNANTAAPIILETGEPVMAVGGFIGADPILVAGDIERDVAAGTVRFFLLQGARAPGANGPAPVSGAGGRRQATAPPASVANTEESSAAQPIGVFAGAFGQRNPSQTWVAAHCATVPTDEWRSAPAAGGGAGAFGFTQQLYDCAKLSGS